MDLRACSGMAQLERGTEMPSGIIEQESRFPHCELAATILTR